MQGKLGLAAGVLAAVSSGCPIWETGGSIGGANQGVQSPGNRQGGIALSEGDVAVSPNGKFFAALKSGSLVVGEVGGDSSRTLKDLPRPERVAFWPESMGEGLFILANGKRNGSDGQPQTVFSYNRAEERVVWSQEMDRRDRWLDATPDGSRVVLTGADVGLMDGRSGAVMGTFHAGSMNIRDLDITRDGKFFYVTEETGPTSTRVTVHETESGNESCEVEANNCADELVLAPNDERAFLSPTICQQDPVTVLQLGKNGCRVERQMPGFGPVALSPDGKTAVAFLDRDAVDVLTNTQVPKDVSNSRTRFHLMFIDVNSLDYNTQSHGNMLPRYAFTPDGASLLVDEPMDPFARIKVLGVGSSRKHTVVGPPVKLHSLSFSPDSSKAFVLDQGLFELDVSAARLRPIPLAFPPAGINIGTDGMTLLITNKVMSAVHFIDSNTALETGHIRF